MLLKGQQALSAGADLKERRGLKKRTDQYLCWKHFKNEKNKSLILTVCYIRYEIHWPFLSGKNNILKNIKYKEWDFF